MNEQGVKALEKRIASIYGPPLDVDRAALILGEHGLFIADVREHEPVPWNVGAEIACVCGYVVPAAESYFDHIGGPE